MKFDKFQNFQSKINKLIILDKATAKIFLEKIVSGEIPSINSKLDFRFEERVSLCNEYVDKFYAPFLDSDDALEKFHEIELGYRKWIDLLKNSKFHKSIENRGAFEEFMGIREMSKSFLKQDNYEAFDYRFLGLVWQNFRTVGFAALETALHHDRYPNFMSAKQLFGNKNEATSGFSAYYSRSFLVNNILKDLSAQFFLLAHSEKVSIEIIDLPRAVMHFLLYLEGAELVKTDVINKSIKGRVVHLVKHKSDFNVTARKTLEFPLFYLNLNMFEPILMVNEYFKEARLTFGNLVQVQDYVYISNPIMQKNQAYGFIEEAAIPNSLKPKDDAIITLEKPTIHYVKKSPQFDFFSKENGKLKSTLKKDNDTKIYIDWTKFGNALTFFKEDALLASGINEDTDDDLLLSLLNTHSNIENNENKAFLSNILLFVYLKLFIKKFGKTDGFYYCHSLDFRGRKYYSSMLSATSFKLTRYFTYYGYFTKKEISEVIKLSLQTEAIKVITPLLDKTTRLKNFLNYTHFTGKDSETLRYKSLLLTHFIIAVGIIFKSEILRNREVCKDGFTLTTEMFFDKGAEEFLKYGSNRELYLASIKDVEDRFKLSDYFDKLEKPIDLCKKEAIGLDFSCSGHQLRYLLNRPKTSKGYDLINLSGWDSCIDIYNFIIETFKREIYRIYTAGCASLLDARAKHDVTAASFSTQLHKLFKNWNDLQEFLDFLERAHVKKPIMTEEYNASLLTFLDYFFESFFKKHPNKKTTDFKKKMTLILIGLYRFSKTLGSETSEFSSNECVKEKLLAIELRGYKLNMWDNFEVNFAIFQPLQVDKRVSVPFLKNNKRVRHTHKLMVYASTVDKKATQTAMMPNFIHAVDGSLVRAVNYYNKQNHSYITIHDEFLIPQQLVFLFKDQINKIIKLDFFLDGEPNSDFKPLKIDSKPLNLPEKLYCYNIIL